MKKRILLLFNSAAGLNARETQMSQLVNPLAMAGCEVTVYPIMPDHGITSESILAMGADNYDVIVCAGGDGTLNHMINAMKRHGIDKPIGYFPSGSANDFAHNIYGDQINDIEKIAQAIAGDKTFVYDIGQFEDHYFNYVAAFGAFTKVSYQTSREMKNAIGYLAYVLSAIGNLPESLSLRIPMEVDCDGKILKDEYILGAISNTRSVGGMKPAMLNQTELNDGMLELTLIKAPNNLADFSEIISALASNSESHFINKLVGRSFYFRTEKDVTWTLDGETGITYKDVHINVVPQAIKIMIP